MATSNTLQAPKKHSQVAIALGSNLGDSLANLENALVMLNETHGLTQNQVSSWYRSKAMGPPQPDYLNGCATFQTSLTPQAVLRSLQAVEAAFHRTRDVHWGPRTLDLDLILFDNLILNEAALTIPHPGMQKRSFVLAPLAEIAPDWLDPKTELSIKQLLQKINCDDLLEIIPR